jgi:hypothetical protein
LDLDVISERDIRISDRVIAIFKNWNNEYNCVQDKSYPRSHDDITKIEEYRKKGGI